MAMPTPAASHSPRLSVVVMAFNEVASLPATVGELHAELVRLGESYEVLIVDDGSTDGTGALAEALATTLPGVRVHHHPTNLGLGGVYRTGFAEARGDLLTFFPADGQFAAALIGDYLAAIVDADMVLGVLPKRDDSITGKLLSAAERMLLRLLFRNFPRFQGILMFRRDLLDRTPLVSQGRGWTVLMELILRQARSGARIKNIDIEVRPRAQGASKVNNLRSIVSNLRQVLGLRRHL
jgi:glycosyltransferase involved in cell wall biosynthesis